MNLQGKLSLAFLEEDRPQGGLFRVKPLLNDDTVFAADLKKELPDDGYLRVVPDKDEQRTFKTRMREIAPLCVLDLTGETKGKVKKNRNYRPDKNEFNQNVIYSDVIRPCPKDLMYQVVQESGLENAVTEMVYIRSGANIQGPYLRTGEAAGETEKLPPDSRFLKTVELPDGRALLIYWPARPAEEKEPSPLPLNAAEQIQALNDDLKGLNNPLKETPEPVRDLPAPPVGKGTPLLPALIAPPAVKKAVNPLAQAVEAQRKGAAEPGSTEEKRKNARDELPEKLRNGLNAAMKTAGGRRALADLMQDLGAGPGFPGAVALNSEEDGLSERLQDLEAERLHLIMQLDEAKKDQKAYADKVIKSAEAEKKRELDALIGIIGEKRRIIDELTEKQETLIRPADEAPLPAAGRCAPPEEMIRQVLDAFHASGFAMNRTEAAALMAVIAQCRGIFAVSTVERSDPVIFADAVKDAFGVPVRMPGPAESAPEGSDGLRLTCVSGGMPAARGAEICFVPTVRYELGDEIKDLFALSPFAFIPLPRAQGILKAPLPAAAVPVSAAWLRHVFAPRELDLEAQDMLRRLQGKLPAAVLRLCAGLISAVHPYAEGSLRDVTDLALSYCAVPYIRIAQTDTADILPLIKGMPRTLRMLSDGQ